MKRERSSDDLLGSIETARQDISRAYAASLNGLEGNDVILACTFLIRVPLERTFRKQDEQVKYGRLFEKHGSALVHTLCDYIKSSTKAAVTGAEEDRTALRASKTFQINDAYKKACYIVGAVAMNRFLSPEDKRYVEGLLAKYNKLRDGNVKGARARAGELRKVLDGIQDEFRGVAERLNVKINGDETEVNADTEKAVQDVVNDIIGDELIARVNAEVLGGKYDSYYDALVAILDEETTKEPPTSGLPRSVYKTVFLHTLKAAKDTMHSFMEGNAG